MFTWDSYRFIQLWGWETASSSGTGGNWKELHALAFTSSANAGDTTWGTLRIAAWHIKSNLIIHFDGVRTFFWFCLSFSYHFRFSWVFQGQGDEKKLVTPKLLYEQTWSINYKELIPAHLCGLSFCTTSFCSSKALREVIFFGLCSDPKVFPKQDAACDIAKWPRCHSVTNSTTHVTKESCNPPVQLGGAAFPLRRLQLANSWFILVSEQWTHNSRSKLSRNLYSVNIV